MAESFADADRNPPVFDPDRHTISVPGELAKSVQAVKDAEWWRIGIAEEIGGCARARGADVGDQRDADVRQSVGGLLVRTGPGDGQRALRRGQRTAEALGRNGSGAGLGGDHGADRAGRRLRCRRGPRQGHRPTRRHLAHRGREAVHLRRRCRRYRREHLPPGAGPTRGRRTRHQGSEPVLRAEVSVRPRHARTRPAQRRLRDRPGTQDGPEVLPHMRVDVRRARRSPPSAIWSATSTTASRRCSPSSRTRG